MAASCGTGLGEAWEKLLRERSDGAGAAQPLRGVDGWELAGLLDYRDGGSVPSYWGSDRRQED